MSKILHVFDVSPFIHAGHVNKYAKLEKLVNMGSTWCTNVLPAGGISLIFNTLYNVLGTGDCVFCCDRNPTIKKDMLPTYKNNRDHNRDIQADKAVAEYILEKCNCTLIARQGYEADDIIYSIVKKFYKAYDYIYIYTGDSDLYFLVDEKVSIKPSSSRAKEVTLENYESVAGKGFVKYNSITINKIIKGDTSDCIPPLPINEQEIVKELFDKDVFYPKLGDKEFVKGWVDMVIPSVSKQVDLVFPLEVDELPEDFSKPDKQAIINWGDVIGNKLFRNRAQRDFDATEYIDEMCSLGYYILEDI